MSRPHAGSRRVSKGSPPIRRFGWAFALIVVELAAGVLAQHLLAPGVMHWVLWPWVGLTLVHNPGAMLGLLSSMPALVTGLTVVGGVLLGYWTWHGGVGSGGAALMWAGAMGNLADRLHYGYVVDFIHVAGWPGIFNLADVALRVGAVVALIGLFQGGRRVVMPGREE